MATIPDTIDRFLDNKSNRWAIIVLLGALELLLIAGIGLILYVRMKDPQANLLSSLLPGPPTSTPACVHTVLMLNKKNFPVADMATKNTAALRLPSTPGSHAYRFTGAPAGYLLGLNPSPDALSLRGTLEIGGEVRITWPDCSFENFIIQSLTRGEPDTAALFRETDNSLRIFIPGENGLTVKGVPATEFAVALATENAATQPKPDTCTPALKIGAVSFSIQEITPAADGSLDVPLEPALAAYHVSGSAAYALSADASNMALGIILKAGDHVTLIGPDCRATVYELTQPQTGATYDPANPTTLTIFIAGAAPGQGFAVRGKALGAVEEPPSPPRPPAWSSRRGLRSSWSASAPKSPAWSPCASPSTTPARRRSCSPGSTPSSSRSKTAPTASWPPTRPCPSRSSPA
jgi:hypothetical protein